MGRITKEVSKQLGSYMVSNDKSPRQVAKEIEGVNHVTIWKLTRQGAELKTNTLEKIVDYLRAKGKNSNIMNDELFSDCCGVPPLSGDSISSDDIGICPECLEHCEYESEEP